MTLTTEQINELLGIKESYKASDRLMEILFNKEKRRELFLAFLKKDYELEKDWFHVYFQDEHADRKLKKQDFTPNEISEVLSQIVESESDNGTRLDSPAGTGGLTIKKWHADCLKHSPFDYKPSMYLYQCEELSDRALPFLLFNLLIRGMNATVIHGDSLTREVNQVYFIQNDDDDLMMFSSLNVMPHSSTVMKEFDVRIWLEDEIKHIESPLSVVDRYMNVLELDEKVSGQLKLF